jgi:hypothetical protein
MSLRVGVLLVITGLTLAIMLGSLFVAVGGFLAMCGGIVMAIGMESVLAEQSLDADAPAKADAEHGIAA